MINGFYAFLLLTITYSGQSLGAQVSVTAGYGYDSNPFKIPDKEAPNIGSDYKTFKVKYQSEKQAGKKTKKPKLRYRFELRKDIYGQGSSDADSSTIRGRLDWTERFKIGDRKASVNLGAHLRREDNTYYSQTQRQVAETREGDLIDARRSFDSAELRVELKYYLNKKISWSVSSKIGQRNYHQDYENIGLERLDFNEFRIQPGIRYKGDSGLTTRIFVYQGSRNYKGVLNESNDQSSLLTYSLNGYGVALSKAINTHIDGSIYLSGYLARDNGKGIRDLNYHKLIADLSYQLARKAKVSLKTEAYWKHYINSQQPVINSNAGKYSSSRDGAVVKFVYSRPVFSDSFRGSITLQRRYENNEIVSLCYQREILTFGLQYQL